jgi:hypothetical protein
LSTALLHPIETDYTDVIQFIIVDSLVVQLLPPTVELISAKADLKITKYTLVELYLQNRKASLT